MTTEFKNILEDISSSQMARLKKEYEPLRKIDMSKHKGQIEKTTAMLSKLKMGTLIDLSKEDIPVISDVAKSLVKKDKRFAHHVEKVEEIAYDVAGVQPMTGPTGLISAIKVKESLIMGLNKSSAEYKAGKAAAKKGEKYDTNPHEPGVKRLNWSTGHNDFRADNLRKAGKPNYGARGQFEEVELDEVSYRGYEIKRQNNKYGHPLIVPALKLTGVNMKDIKALIDRHFLFSNEEVQEADLTKTQIKMVHKQADELPKNDFIKRYGKDGDAVRYATATNQIKKKLGIDEGTWHIAKDMTKLKNTMKQPMPLGTGSFDFVAKYIGDDELWDDLGALKKNQDMVPAIKKAMKRLGIKEEVTEDTSPEVANVLKKYVTGHPLRWSTRQGVKNRKDFETLQALALKDMKAFRSKFNDMKAKPGEDNYQQAAVRAALEKAGLSRHLTDENKIEGDEIMNEDRGFSSSQIKQAYGVLNDPRYKQGNYSGAVAAIEKIAKGLSDHPDVANALKRANESFSEDHDCDNEHPGVSHESWKSKKKLSASYESRKYFDTKPGSIQDTVKKMYEDNDEI